MRPAAPRGQRLAATGLSEGKRECAQKKEEPPALARAPCQARPRPPQQRQPRPGDIYGHVAGDRTESPLPPALTPPAEGAAPVQGSALQPARARLTLELPLSRLEDFIFICKEEPQGSEQDRPAPTVTTSLLVPRRPIRPSPEHSASRPEIIHSPATALPWSLESHILLSFSASQSLRTGRQPPREQASEAAACPAGPLWRSCCSQRPKRQTHGKGNPLALSQSLSHPSLKQAQRPQLLLREAVAPASISMAPAPPGVRNVMAG